MRLSHLEAFRPDCLHCRQSGKSAFLALSEGQAGADGWVEWGILGCPVCGMEYPIVDGAPEAGGGKAA